MEGGMAGAGKEALKRLYTIVREFWFGKCPICGSTNIKTIKNWNKYECERCGATWDIL